MDLLDFLGFFRIFLGFFPDLFGWARILNKKGFKHWNRGVVHSQIRWKDFKSEKKILAFFYIFFGIFRIFFWGIRGFFWVNNPSKLLHRNGSFHPDPIGKQNGRLRTENFNRKKGTLESSSTSQYSPFQRFQFAVTEKTSSDPFPVNSAIKGSVVAARVFQTNTATPLALGK